MNRRHLCVFIALAVASIFVLSACGSPGKQKRWSYKRGHLRTVERVTVSSSGIDLVVNDKVRAWLDYFQGAGRDRFQVYLERSGRYKDIMVPILREYGVPENIFYLALIESGFSHRAHSWANAVGYWQFIRSTGAHYGLRIDSYIDERKDPVRSTHAAANFLAHLYKNFGDWYLAFAAYNAGPGKIRNAIDMYGTNDFWRLTTKDKKYLRPETKDYVPKYIAATIIARNPKKFGFQVDYQEPMEFEEVAAVSQTDFDVVAACAGVDAAAVEELNPKYLLGVTPPNERNHIFRVPKKTAKKFLVAFTKLPKHKRLVRQVEIAENKHHKVRKGETLAGIAQKYGVSQKSILSANRMKNAKHLKRGKVLLIPGSVLTQTSAPAISDVIEMTKSPVKKRYIRHKIKKGETLSSIARKYNVEIADIKHWNKLNGSNIMTGQTLKVIQTGTTTTVAKVPVKEAVDVAETETETETEAGAEAEANVDAEVEVAVDAEKIIDEMMKGKTAGQEAAKVAKAGTHKVKGGDTLYSIARSNNMSVAQLCELNNISRTALIKPGMVIRLNGTSPGEVRPVEPAKSDMVAMPEKKVVKPRAKKGAAAVAGPIYKVKSGDNAWTIAKRHNLSISEIQTLNTGKDISKLKPGDTIKVK